MRDYKQEFQEARDSNDWSRVDELWQQLCKDAGIEEQSDGSEGESVSIAARRNQQATGQMPGGKKI
jgi:hypothetical protein